MNFSDRKECLMASSIICDRWWYLKVVYQRRHESVKIHWWYHRWAGRHHWPGLGALWWFENQARLAGPCCRLAGCCAQAWSSGWTAPTGAGLGLLNVAVGDGILVNLAILAILWWSVGWWFLGWRTVIWSLPKLPGVDWKERNSNEAF